MHKCLILFALFSTTSAMASSKWECTDNIRGDFDNGYDVAIHESTSGEPELFSVSNRGTSFPSSRNLLRETTNIVKESLSNGVRYTVKDFVGDKYIFFVAYNEATSEPLENGVDEVDGKLRLILADDGDVVRRWNYMRCVRFINN